MARVSRPIKYLFCFEKDLLIKQEGMVMVFWQYPGIYSNILAAASDIYRNTREVPVSRLVFKH
jgi:hypothetical protein